MNDVPKFGDAKDAWFVLGKASLVFNAKNAEPRAFLLQLVWVLKNAKSDHEPGWLVSNLNDVPLEYKTYNNRIMAPIYDGVRTEQVAWSDYMRHVEHEMAVVRSNANYQLKQMKAVSDYVRAEWIRVQTETPIANLVPPELSPDRDLTVR